MKFVSFLFLAAALFALLLFAARLESVRFPDLLDVFVEFFLSDFDGGRQDSHNVGVAVLVRPVGSSEAMSVSLVFNVG